MPLVRKVEIAVAEYLKSKAVSANIDVRPGRSGGSPPRKPFMLVSVTAIEPTGDLPPEVGAFDVLTSLVLMQDGGDDYRRPPEIDDALQAAMCALYDVDAAKDFINAAGAGADRPVDGLHLYDIIPGSGSGATEGTDWREDYAYLVRCGSHD